MNYSRLTEKDDAALAALIRHALRKHDLALPGTVYFDEGLDHLSAFYSAEPERRVYLVLKEGERLLGGIGLAEFTGECAELQKLYLADAMQGRGLGYQMIARIEAEAKARGYRRMYLETHTNLEAAIHIYEKSGYKEIGRPESVVHSTMNRFYQKTLA